MDEYRVPTKAPGNVIEIRKDINTEIIRINHDGRIFWRGREIEADSEFKAAMLDLRDALCKLNN